jgi:molybdate transport system substrate-binding protein
LANQLKLKALDAAIIWDATARQYPQDIDAVSIDDTNFHSVPLAIGIMKQTNQRDLAQSFAEFAAGDLGAKYFRDNHYQVPGKQLRIGCGSSMRPPVEDLAKLFQETYGTELLRDYGGSGTVLLQIEESKEGDIYICHDPYAYVCEDKKISERWHTIAYIDPTIAVLKGNPKNVKGLKDLARTDLKLGLPHRDHSTRGKILWEIFKKNGMAEEIEKRKFFESRTHDLINQLKLNTVDVAVLWDAPVRAMPEFEAIPIEDKYKVDAITSATSGRTYSMEHVKVTVVRLNFSKEPLLAAQFAKLCLSDDGRNILKKHCFSLPEIL